ncbi:MAG: hypothetical protein ACR2PS_11080 [Pseudomonadales bacterium]
MPKPEDTGITARRSQAGRTNIDAVSFEALEMRALIELMSKRDNYLTNRIIELQDALTAIKNSSGAASGIRDAIPASFMSTNTRVRRDAIQAYKDLIAAGDADP